MCPEQDSNLHVVKHTHLKRARLPFRHLGAYKMAAPYKQTLVPFQYFKERAVNETRTRDPDLGKVVLYQLSYYRLLTLCVLCISLNAVQR